MLSVRRKFTGLSFSLRAWQDADKQSREKLARMATVAMGRNPAKGAWKEVAAKIDSDINNTMFQFDKPTPEEVYEIVASCDKCRTGMLLPHGKLVATSTPAVFPHKCDQCGTVQDLDKVYPFAMAPVAVAPSVPTDVPPVRKRPARLTR